MILILLILKRMQPLDNAIFAIFHNKAKIDGLSDFINTSTSSAFAIHCCSKNDMKLSLFPV